MKALATGTAAMSILLTPCSLMAQEAAPNIAITHAALAASARPQATARISVLTIEKSATDISPDLSPASTIMDGFAGLAAVKGQSIDRGWDGGAFHLAAMRGRSAAERTAGQSFDYQHFAAVAVGTGVSGEISDRDRLTLGGIFAAELRRPAFIVGPHRNFRTDERVAALHWTRDTRFDLAGFLFDSGPAKPRTAVERIADLAGGARRSVGGWGVTASLFPSREPERLTVGIDVRDQQDRDVGHRDARMQIFLRKKF